MSQKSLLGRFLIWRAKNIKHRQFVIILSILVGFASGLAAVVIKNSAHYIQELLTMGFAKEYHNYLYFAYPLIGILLTVLIARYLIRERISQGIPAVLYAISKRNSIMKRHNLFSSIITSSITVGFGGSAGLEGPTVATSGAIGSHTGQLMRMNFKTTTLLLGCGAAGAMAGIFNAPIAAIVFAIEVIMLDLTTASLIPLLLASVSAALTSKLILGDNVLFNVPLKEGFIINELPYFVLLGILTGFVSFYFARVFFFIDRQFEKVKNIWTKAITAGVMLGVLIFFIPPLYGEGYGIINLLLNGNYEKIVHNSIFYDYREYTWLILILLAGMALFKVIATSITFGGGGKGGIFAPSMFMGASVGFVFSKTLNYLGLTNIPVNNFTLVGMAGMLAGVLHAPLTGLFLIAEITSSYELIIPLMITVAISYITVHSFSPNSVYTLQLAKRGELITHHKDKAVLTLMKLKSEVETNFKTIKPGSSLREIVDVVSKSKRNIFPVVGKHGHLHGIVLLDDIREIMFKPQLYDEVYIESLMSSPPEYVSSSDTMDTVMKKFEESGAWNLPVVDDGKYIGFVSKSKLFNAYRKVLRDFSED